MDDRFGPWHSLSPWALRNLAPGMEPLDPVLLLSD